MVDVIIDAGHGGNDTGVTGVTGLKEKECTLIIAKKCGEYLTNKKVNVKYTREKDISLSTEERIKIANESEAKLFVSIHVNSVNDSSIKGCEVYTLAKGTDGEKLSTNIIKSITSNIALESRGVKFANFTLLRDITRTAVLIEVCCISNPREETLLRDDGFKSKIGEYIAKGIIAYINNNEVDEVEYDNNFNIISGETAIDAQAMQWAKDRGATEIFIALAKTYWNLINNNAVEVNPVVAYAQAALESNYGKYNNNIDESFKNPCALRKKDSSDDNRDSYEKFTTWENGVLAHLDHLALYGGAEGYPKRETSDPRHFNFLLGRAKTVLDLSGNWSPMKSYGKTILNYVEEINGTIVKDKFDDYNITENTASAPVSKKIDKTNYDKIKTAKEEIIELYDILVSLKQKVDSINETMEGIENDLENDGLKSDELLKKNKALSDKINNYEDAITSVLKVLKNEQK